MNTVTAFILGLLVGWVIEWIIDWVYWRRRTAELTRKLESAEKSGGGRPELEAQLSRLKLDNAALQDKVTALEARNVNMQTPARTAPEITIAQPAAANTMVSRRASVPVTPDDLVVIKGIGPVISKKLNDAGISTYQELAAMTPSQLREIVGDLIQRLANEDDILNQAKELAARQDKSPNSL
jgi:predicted flap endonuclease-1-like 5' DNA nuclease